MKPNSYLFFVLLVLVAYFGWIFTGTYLKKSAIIADKKVSEIPTKVEVIDKMLSDFAIQAWIYPGEPSCNAMSEIADGRKIDVLKAEYFVIAENGEPRLLTEENSGCNGYSVKNVGLIKNYSKHQFVVVSANHIDMRVLFADDNRVSKAVELFVGFVMEHDLSGIEIDFEDFSSWTKNDYSNYKKFVKLLSERAGQNNKLTMVDGPPIAENTQHNYQWRYADFNDLPVNFILVMAYDNQYDSEKNSFVSPNEWVRENVEYIMKEVEPQKLVVGVPAYGYHINIRNQIVLDTQDQSIKYQGYEKAKLSPDSFEYYWWEKNAFYVTQKKDGLAKKINFIRSLGITNISIWHLGGNPWFE